MANPQLENGHTQIANELLEAIYKIPLSDYEHRVFWFIIRKTYGYRKKLDWIAQIQIVEGTGIYKSHVSRTVKKLLEKKMITKEGKQVGVQKDYDLWVLPKQVTHEKLPKQVSEVTPIGNNKLPKQVYTKEKKETITKEIYLDILNCWNNKNIKIHSISESIKKQMRVTLKKYKKDEILLAIDHYSIMLKDIDCKTVSYTWPLEIFLKQSNCLPYFLDDGVRWINYKQPSQKGEIDNYDTL